MALYVRKTPIGNSINVESHIPEKGDKDPSLAAFSPLVLLK